MKIKASRLSEGNKLFPAEIHLEQSGLNLKFPGFFSGQSKFFAFENIASVDITTPLMGYSTITIFAGGTQMTAHGFTKAEVKRVKELVENAKIALNNPVRSKPPIVQTTSDTKPSVADELKKMKELLDAGVITQQEFEAHKLKLLSQ